MLLQTKGKFFSKPNLIFNLILYYMLFLKQSKLAPQCLPQQPVTPSSKPSRSPLLCVLSTKVYCPDIHTTNPNLPCCRLPLCGCKRERERGFNNCSCKILWLRYMIIDPFFKQHSHSVLACTVWYFIVCCQSSTTLKRNCL